MQKDQGRASPSRFIRRVAVLALTVLAAARPASSQMIVIRMATLVPKGSSWHSTLQEMARRWRETSRGRVILRLYPGGVAGDDSDVVRKMRLGVLGGGALTAAGLGDIDRSVFALAIPMAYASYDELDYVMDRLTPRLQQSFAQKGFVVLNWADAGWLHFFTTTRVRTPEDLKALKLFTGSGDTPTVELWHAAGFTPVPLPMTEISTALQTGLVTAVAATPKAAALLQWYRHAKYMNDLNWAVLLGGTVVAKEVWDRIPADLQPALLEAARDAGGTLSAQTRGEALRDIAAMERRGLVLVHVNAADQRLWLRAAQAAYPALCDSFVPCDAFRGAIAFRDEYRQAAPSPVPR
jgi:TRAP-type C4-dicarboxylate transport system substrate-binding protein